MGVCARDKVERRGRGREKERGRERERERERLGSVGCLRAHRGAAVWLCLELGQDIGRRQTAGSEVWPLADSALVRRLSVTALDFAPYLRSSGKKSSPAGIGW